MTQYMCYNEITEKKGGGFMEISLKKIELVKDRTGVSYKEAKEALTKKEEEAPAEPPAPPAPSAEEVLLTEIRDLLKEK